MEGAMLMKIVKEAGYEIISNEDRACLLTCVESLQVERDKYKNLLLTMANLDDVAYAEEHF
jgi:hypothetical protein